MTLFQKIKADQILARKQHFTSAASLLTTLLGEATAIGKNDGGRDPSDTEVIALMKKFIKGMDETLGYLDAAEGDNAQARIAIAHEKEILSAYLPAQYSEGELRTVISGIIVTEGSNMGKIMSALKTHHSGMYDGKLASTIIKELL